MIIGIGTDLVSFQHFKKNVIKTPAVIERVFTEKERQTADHLSGPRKIAYYAKRFAAKEALSKACGTGIGHDISWQDMEILNDEKGAPVAILSPKALHFLQKKFHTKNVTPFVSLTDEDQFAAAFAILTKGSK